MKNEPEEVTLTCAKCGHVEVVHQYELDGKRLVERNGTIMDRCPSCGSEIGQLLLPKELLL